MSAADNGSPTEKRKREYEANPATLDSAVNLMPHALTVYNAEKTEVIFSKPPSGAVLRLKDKPPRTGVVKLGKHEIPIRLGAPEYEDVVPLDKLPEGPVIVSALVAEFLVELRDFPHPVWTPDTNPGTAVRDEKGAVVGTTRMTLYNPAYLLEGE